MDKALLFQSLALLLMRNAATPSESKTEKTEAVIGCCFDIISKACDAIDASQTAVLCEQSKLLCSLCFKSLHYVSKCGL
jgi:hypothetical protein